MWWCISVATAATFTVPDDFPTIADAVQATDPGDTIVLRGTTTESVDLRTSRLLEADATEGGTWQADGAAALTVRGSTVSVTVRGITFDGGGAHRGIQVGDAATLTVEGATFVGGRSAEVGGGLFADGSSVLTVRNSTFDGNSAARGGHLGAAGAASVQVEDSVFTSGTTVGAGGGIAVSDMPTGLAQLVRNRFVGNESATFGGALLLSNLTSASLDQNLFCDNLATEGAGAIYSTGTTLASLRGNIFARNETSGLGGAIYANGGEISTTNTHVVGNVAGGEGGAFYLSVGGTHLNMLLAYNSTTDGLAALYDDRGLLRLDHALYHANEPNASTVVAQNTVRADPLLTAWPLVDCTVDGLVLADGSPAIDAGDPALVDLDDSRSDIGAFGGQVPFPLDLDGDGFTAPGLDCNDDDASVFPGAAEVCNGQDDDCDGTLPADEADTDEDGVGICQGDCDDEDPDTFPAATEIIGDGVDQTCDGQETCFVDDDGDGFGGDDLVETDVLTCDDAGMAAVSGDCDDGDEDASPGVSEVECNGVDDDCNPDTPDCPEGSGEGCGCSTSQPGAAAAWLALVALIGWRRRRR